MALCCFNVQNMAALKLGLPKISSNSGRNLASHIKCYTKATTQPKKIKTIESVTKSISSKGFLRPNKPYNAPSNAADRVKEICGSIQIPTKADYKLENLEEKYKLLVACFNEFQHGVPNSQVHEIETIADVLKFYQTSLDTTTPYDELKKMNLPENLHIQYDYVRFNPETDTKFNGKSVFPKSSTLVTGLKYREKYPGYEAKQSWP